MQIDRETIVKLVREASDKDKVDAWHNGFWTLTQEELEHFAKRVAEHSASVEREAIIAILKGIDETEIESPDGWWETSTGAEFGASILAAIRARNNNA